jgi:hypothetical protein
MGRALTLGTHISHGDAQKLIESLDKTACPNPVTKAQERHLSLDRFLCRHPLSILPSSMTLQFKTQIHFQEMYEVLERPSLVYEGWEGGPW